MQNEEPDVVQPGCNRYDDQQVALHPVGMGKLGREDDDQYEDGPKHRHRDLRIAALQIDPGCRRTYWN